MEIKTIAVIGAGPWAAGLLYAAAFAGYRTILEDVSSVMREQGNCLCLPESRRRRHSGKVTPEQRDRGISGLSSALVRGRGLPSRGTGDRSSPRRHGTQAGNFYHSRQICQAGARFWPANTFIAIHYRNGRPLPPAANFAWGWHFFNPVPKMKLLGNRSGAGNIGFRHCCVPRGG